MPKPHPSYTLHEGRYLDRISFVYGGYTGVETKWLDLGKPVDQHVDDLPEEMHDHLLYIGFYQQAIARIRHPRSLMPDVPDPKKREETLLGGIIEVPEKRYVVENAGDTVTLATRAEILEYGQVSPYLTTSLAVLAMTQGWLSEFDDFLPRLPGSPLNRDDFILSIETGSIVGVDYIRD